MYYYYTSRQTQQTNKIHIFLLLLFVIQANKQTRKIFDDIEIKNFYEFVIKCETNKYRWETKQQQQNYKNDNNNGQMIICI